jgi:succinate dehydrogenase / fumarate reductase cytochrome b subunit
MAADRRPLSPHVGIYRWQISNTLSILHRLTGLTLSIGALVLVGWLVSIAAGPGAYGRFSHWLGGPVGAVLLFGWTFCFFYHLGNGIRHLFWDAGLGFEMRQVRISGWIVVVAAVLLTAGFWIAALADAGA